MAKKIHKKIKRKKKNGFTLIELLLSLAVIAILTGASLSIARFSDTQKNLTLSANQLRALIRLAQSYTLAVPSPGTHICGFGVYFVNVTTAQIFYTQASDAEFNNDAETACNSHLEADGVAAHFLDKAILSASSNLITVNNDVFFRVPYGKVYLNGSLLSGAGKRTYTLTSAGATKTVTVNSVGKIE